ncbi:MAG: hypothetical protein ABL925_01955 [Methylococcales bacterium]
MNIKLVKLLGVLCALLLLVIAGEWFYAKSAQKKLLQSISAVKTEEYQADEMPTLDLTEQSEDSFADLVDRPLFIKGRRHVEEAPPEAEQNAAAPAAEFDWQLSGVYSGKKGLAALFSRIKVKVPKDNFRRLSTGADLDGWKLTKIDKDKVLLKQTDTEKELLLRKVKPKTPKAVTNPMAPMRGGMPQAPVPAVPVPEPQPQPDAPVESTEDPFENTTNE